MANGFKTDIDQSKMAAAVLAACIVQTLGESDPSFVERLTPRVEAWHRAMEERGESHAMEALSWFSDALHSDKPFEPYS